MEKEEKNPIRSATPGSTESAEGPGVDSSNLRQRYLQEVGEIKRRIGQLEDVRLKLGFSQRKMCQLLLVDPSAWTRWTKPGQDAPPHVYRALQWFLALQDMYPDLKNPFFLAGIVSAQNLKPEDLARIEQNRSEMKSLGLELLQLNQRFEASEARFRRQKFYATAIVAALSLVLLILILVLLK